MDANRELLSASPDSLLSEIAPWLAPTPSPIHTGTHVRCRRWWPSWPLNNSMGKGGPLFGPAASDAPSVGAGAPPSLLHPSPPPGGGSCSPEQGDMALRELAEALPHLAFLQDNVRGSGSASSDGGAEGACSSSGMAALPYPVPLQGPEHACGSNGSTGQPLFSSAMQPRSSTGSMEQAPLPRLAFLQEPASSSGSDPSTGNYQHAEPCSPAALVDAVGFYVSMFPKLNTEVVADVLQRYPAEAALAQLMMLSACIDEAEMSLYQPPRDDVPDEAGWDSASIGSGAGSGEFALHPLAADSLEAAPPAAAAHVPADDLTTEEKLAILGAEFASLSAEEVRGGLAACEGRLSSAMELLRSFTQERPEVAAACPAAPPASSLPQPSTPPPPPSEALLFGMLPQPQQQDNYQQQYSYEQQQQGYQPDFADVYATDDQLPSQQLLQRRQHTAAQQQLAKLFPHVASDSLELVLQLARGSLDEACQILREQSPATAAGQPARAAAGAAAAVAAQQEAPAAAPLPLSVVTYQRNEGIYQEEREAEQRLREAYRKCFELSQQAYQRGDREQANVLSQEGQRWREQYNQERERSGRRIGRRINAGNMAHIRVDLHGQHLDHALKTVEDGLRAFPLTIPGGVVVRYITGKGLHSSAEGPRIRPAVLALLAERGVPHVEGPGWVEATIGGAHNSGREQR